MPNRGELPIPAMRGKSATKACEKPRGNADAEAWAIIAFCAIGVADVVRVALASLGVSGFRR